MVRNAWVVFKKEWHEQRLRGGGTVLLFGVALAVSCATGLLARELRHSPALMAGVVNLQFSLVALSTSLLVLGFLTPAVCLLEKNCRTIESLLATPLSLREIVFGKAAFMTVTASLLAVLGALGGYVVIARMGAHPPAPSLPSLGFLLVVLPAATLAICSVACVAILAGINPGLVNGAVILAATLGFGGRGFKKQIFGATWSLDVTAALLAASVLVLTMIAASRMRYDRIIAESASARKP